MKKSLIALAVLAASSASFAAGHMSTASGVSITGNLTYGYQSTTTGGVNGGGSSEQAGFGAETANVVFTATEDLGGGFAAKASLKINTNPGAGTTGDDHTLTLITPVGGLTMGTVKNPDYLSGGLAGIGAYYTGWESGGFPTTGAPRDKLFTPRSFRDFVSFTVPVGALTFTLASLDAAGDVAFGQGTTGTLAGTSTGSNAPLSLVKAKYDAGPLAAEGVYMMYKNNNAQNNVKDTTRLAASYDLGMVKLGAGASVANHVATVAGAASPKTTDYMLAAKVPMGASSFGLTYASRTVSDIVTPTPVGAFVNPSTTGTGYSLEYGYAMSKRTSVIANYARWTAVQGFGVANGQDASSQYNLLLSHSF